MIEAALELYASGLTVIPIALDGSKSPAVKSWRAFIDERPTRNAIEAIFAKPCGVAVLGGATSGGLEVIDFDREGYFDDWASLVEDCAPGLVATLPVVKTPNGHHVYFRSEFFEANQKLARSLTKNENKKSDCVIETRGKGGYVIAPPSPAEVHPSGVPYRHLQGPPLTSVPALDKSQRQILLDCARSLNEVVEHVEPRKENTGKTGAGRPGDDFENKATWDEVLTPHGWAVVRQRGDVTYWRRPGKDDKGISATTGARGSGGKFFVFSSNAHPFDANRAYGKFFAHTLLNHAGDFQAAARELGARGLGQPRKKQFTELDRAFTPAPPPPFDDAPPHDDDGGYLTPITAALLDDMLDDDPAAWVLPAVFSRIIEKRADKHEWVLICDVMRRRKKKNEFNAAVKEYDANKKRGVDRDGWRSELLFREMKDGTQKIDKCLSNMVTILKSDPTWRGKIKLDTFSNRLEINGALPFDRDEKSRWSDTDVIDTKAWLERNYDVRPSDVDVHNAIVSVARAQRFNPLMDYLEALPTHASDSDDLIDTWLIDFFGAPDTPLTRAIGAKWLISAVARAYEPGCKVDTVLILEGKQGLKKSRLLSQLCPRTTWFTDGLSDFGSKDQAVEIEGKWIVELAEMKGFGRELEQIKAFVTRQAENYRPPYGRNEIHSPRKCVFAATVNPEAAGYLRDSTGNRRYWPIECTKQAPELADDIRDRLWAEAKRRYQDGEKWYLEDVELIAAAEAEQKKRMTVDLWQEDVEKYLVGKEDVSIREIVQNCLGIDIQKRTHGESLRVGKILYALGWRDKHRPRMSDGTQGAERFRNPSRLYQNVLQFPQAQ